MGQITDPPTLPGQMLEQRDKLVARIPGTDPLKEYVASGLEIGLAQVLRSIPQFTDDLQREHGDEIYWRMLKDSAVYTGFETLVEFTLMSAPRVVSPVTDEKAEDYELAKEISDFVRYNLENMARPIKDSLAEMLLAYVFGSSVAEKVFEPKRTTKFGLMLHLRSLTPLSRRNYSFVVDAWGNVVGLMARLPGQPSPLGYVSPELVVGKDKFVFLTFGTVAGDPRGRSQIRGAYMPWWFKLQVFPRWLKYLQQFSTPSVIGFTPPSGEDDMVELKDENGNPYYLADGSTKKITAEQAMLNALVEFQAGSALALRGGSAVELVKSDGTGEAFINTLTDLDRQIIETILGTAQATMEAQHSSKASAESGQDSLSRKAEWIRGLLDHMLTNEVARHLVALNWDEDTAERYTPRVTLAAVDKEDRAKLMSAVDALWRDDYFDDSQVAGLDAMMGAPERDMEAWLAKRAEQRDQANQVRQAQARISDPLAGLDNGGGAK